MSRQPTSRQAGMRAAATAVLAAALALAACAGPGAGSGAAVSTTSRHDCNGGLILTIVWREDVAEVTVDGGETLRLTRAEAASGARYNDADHEVWEHRGELRWLDGDKPPRTCRKIGDR